MQINGSQCLGAVNRLLRAVYAAGRCTIAVGQEAQKSDSDLKSPGFGATSVKRYGVFARSYFRVKSEVGSKITDRLCRFRATGPPRGAFFEGGPRTAADGVRT